MTEQALDVTLLISLNLACNTSERTYPGLLRKMTHFTHFTHIYVS